MEKNQKIAIPQDGRRDPETCDAECRTETPRNGVRKLLVPVMCVFFVALGLLVLQTGVEMYRLNRRVERFEQLFDAAIASGQLVVVHGDSVQSPASIWTLEEFRNLQGRPAVASSADAIHTKPGDALETSKSTDDRPTTEDTDNEKPDLSTPRRRTKRSYEYLLQDLEKPQRTSRQRRNSGRNHRTTTAASLQSAVHGDHHRRSRHHEVAAYQLTMDVQIYGNDRVRFDAGETIYVAFGEYGPNGFRPSANVMTSDPDNSEYPYRMWKTAEWAQNSQAFHYNPEKGQIVVTKKGIYFIYAQLLYYNAAARSSYGVMTDEAEPLELARCWTSVDIASVVNTPLNANGTNTSTPHLRLNTCHVSVIAMLNANQQVWLQDHYGNYIKPDADANIFGIIRLAEL